MTQGALLFLFWLKIKHPKTTFSVPEDGCQVLFVDFSSQFAGPFCLHCDAKGVVLFLRQLVRHQQNSFFGRLLLRGDIFFAFFLFYPFI